MKKKALILTTVLALVGGVAGADYIPLPVKWSQVPWDFNGTGRLSDCSLGQVMADDFVCQDPLPIVAVRWWGSYPLGHQPMPGLFHISFHFSVGPHPSSIPGQAVTFYPVFPQEARAGVDNAGVPVYRYDAYLPQPFDQHYYSRLSPNMGELFIDICKPTGEGWGWREVVPPHPIMDFAAKAPGHFAVSWTSTYQTDMAFELMVVPEPATLALLGLGGVAMLIRRRRSKIRPGGRR